MCALPRALSWGRALGIYLAEGHLTLTEIASTPAGTKVQRTARLPIDEAGPGKALAAWFESNLTPRQRRSLPICIGLAAEQTFFTSRHVEETQGEAPTPEALLASCGNSSLDPAEAVTGCVKRKLPGGTVYSIAACRGGLAKSLGEAIKTAGVQNARLGPAPCWVLNMADRSAKPPRGWKTCVRVLLGEHGGLAMLVAHGKPLLWRRFAIAEASAARDLASAIRHVEVHAEKSLGIKGVSGVFLQGRADEAMAEALRQEVTLEVAVAPGAELDEAAYSQSLALAARKPDPDGIDLLGSVRAPPTLGQMFPRHVAAGMVMVAAGVGLFLWSVVTDLDREYESVRRQSATYKWAQKLRTEKINSEKKLLTAEVEAVQGFLGTRVVWSDYLRDLPTRLPPNSCLRSMDGQYEMKAMSAKKAGTQARVNRSLTIRGMARFTDRGMAPKEIDSLLESLRGVELLKRDFPLVNLAEIKWRKEGTGDIATFTIVAMPKTIAAGSEEEKEKPAKAEKG